MERKKKMGMHITSKFLKPAVGALGVAFLIGPTMGACGHHAVSTKELVSMSPSSAQFEIGHTVK
jgi:hypothetical protein